MGHISERTRMDERSIYTTYIYFFLFGEQTRDGSGRHSMELRYNTDSTARRLCTPALSLAKGNISQFYDLVFLVLYAQFLIRKYLYTQFLFLYEFPSLRKYLTFIQKLEKNVQYFYQPPFLPMCKLFFLSLLLNFGIRYRIRSN